MAKITRVSQLLFGSTGPSGDFGVFGSLNTTPTYSKDPATIQSLTAFLTGWAAAVKAGDVPALEDMNSLFLLAFYQIGYLLQQGVAEWISDTTYYTNSVVSYGGKLYISLQDTNLNKDPVTQTAWWQEMIVDLTNNQTIAGIKTFSSFPITPSSAPTTNYQASNKKYVDDSLVGKAASGANSDITSLAGITALSSLAKAASFSGTGTQGSAVAHGLGRVPIFIRWMSTNSDSGDGCVWISGMGASCRTQGGSIEATTTAPDATYFYLGPNGDGNNNGRTYYFIVF